jgi:hypothetical protein
MRRRDGRACRDRAPVDLPRGARAARGRPPLPPPTEAERVALYRELLIANVAARGPRYGVQVTRRHLGFLGQRSIPRSGQALHDGDAGRDPRRAGLRA